MSILIYWFDTKPNAARFSDSQLSDALKFSEKLRKEKTGIHICISSDYADCVGEMGVADIDKDYEWSKQHRGNHGTIPRK